MRWRQAFLDDLANATEIVITPRNKVRPHEPGPRARSELGSSTRALKDATRVGSVLGAAVRGHRTLEPREIVARGRVRGGAARASLGCRSPAPTHRLPDRLRALGGDGQAAPPQGRASLPGSLARRPVNRTGTI